MKRQIKKFNLEDIKEFLAINGYIWNGRIRDLFKMLFRPATMEDFIKEKMIRLLVTTPQYKEEFIQRIIVSDFKFKIENTSLNKMDNFEDFSSEWIEFLKSKMENNIDLQTSQTN